MRKTRWHKIGISLILLKLIFGAGLPHAPLYGQETHSPLLSTGDLDICAQGTGTGQISGQITRAANGTPVEGIRVYLETVYGDNLAFRTAVLTDAEGNYAITAVPGGIYVVRADTSAHNRDNSNAPALVSSIYDGQTSLASFTPVQVTDTQTTPDIDFALVAGGTIKGSIFDAASGEPLTEVGEVILYDAQNEGARVASYITPGSGVYTFTVGLLPGSYKIGYRVVALEMEPVFYPNTTSFEAAESIEIAGTETVTVDLAVTVPEPPQTGPVGEVRGRITAAGLDNETDNLRDLARIRAFVGDSIAPSASTQIDANGLYTLTVPAGSIRLMVEPGFGTEIGPRPGAYTRQFYNGKDTLAQADLLTVPANEVVNNVDFALERGAHINGRVTYTDGTGVANATVSAFTGQFFNNTTQSARNQTSAAGNYSLTALAPGVYTVTASLVSTLQGCYHTTQVTTIQIDDPDSDPVLNFTMARGAYITGRVMAEDTDAGAAVFVHALRPEDPDTTGSFRAVSAGTGYYRLGPLPPGEYKLRFVSPPDAGLESIYAGGTTDRDEAQVFVITSDEIVTGVDGVLTPMPHVPDDPQPIYLPSLRR